MGFTPESFLGGILLFIILIAAGFVVYAGRKKRASVGPKSGDIEAGSSGGKYLANSTSPDFSPDKTIPNAVTFDLKLIQIPAEPANRPAGMVVASDAAGIAVVSSVTKSAEAWNLGVRPGDIIHWAGSGGEKARFDEFQGLATKRPLRFEVLRPSTTVVNTPAGVGRSVSGVLSPKKTQRSPNARGIPSKAKPGLEVAEPVLEPIDFILDVSDQALLKLNKAMQSFKQSEGVDTLMPIRVSSIKAYHVVAPPHVGATTVDIAKTKGPTYRTFSGVYNEVQSILLKQLVLNGEEKEMFEQMKAWGITNSHHAKLSHPNVLRLLATCFEPQLIASLYEGTTGVTLDTLCTQKRFKWKDLSSLNVAYQLANGTAYIHATLGQPHGFLCPANVQFSNAYQLKVCNACSDSGFWTNNYIATSHTRSLMYLSPRVLKGEKPTFKDDVYSYGMILLGPATDSGSAFTHYMDIVKSEQLVPGGSESTLAKKLQQKIEKKDLRLEFSARMCPVVVKQLLQSCVKSNPDEITVTLHDIMARLKGDIRTELEKPHLFTPATGAVAAAAPAPADVVVEDLDEDEMLMKKILNDDGSPRVEEEVKADDVRQPATSAVKVPVAAAAADTKVENVRDRDSDSSDSDSDSDVSL
jgi:serine/threonine protein kinase